MTFKKKKKPTHNEAKSLCLLLSSKSRMLRKDER